MYKCSGTVHNGRKGGKNNLTKTEKRNSAKCENCIRTYKKKEEKNIQKQNGINIYIHIYIYIYKDINIDEICTISAYINMNIAPIKIIPT